MRIVLRILSIIVALAAAACGSTERTTAQANPVMPKEAAMLSGIIANTGVRVAPLDGVSAQIGQPIIEAVSEALIELDIPAIAGQPLAGAHQLNGQASLSQGSIRIAWTLRRPDGEELMAFGEREAALSASAIQALAGRTAQAIAPLFNTAGGLDEDMAPVIVADIQGAPGDGGTALPLALRRALSGAGVKVFETGDAKAVQVQGQVRMSDINPSTQTVSLIWRVLAPDGGEIGVIDQSNQVAAGQLDRNWGEIAFLAADGARDGIIELLNAYWQRPPPAPPGGASRQE